MYRGCSVVAIRSGGLRPPPQSDSVRRPIEFRPPPDQIPFAARSDSVRRPMISVELLVCANSVEKCRYVT